MSLLSIYDCCFWLIDASYVEYLDLAICEFQREKMPSLISSLNLSLPSTPLTAPYIPLVRVFKTKPGRRSFSMNDWTATVFFDFSRNILQVLKMNCKTEIAKFYLNHLTAFCHYVERHFYSAICFTYSIAQETKYDFLQTSRTQLINSLKLHATRKLVDILFQKAHIDSGIITYMLDIAQYSWIKLVQLSFKSDPAITDSILSYLRKNKCWMTTEQLINLSSPDEVEQMVLNRPKNFLIFLNYGFKNIYDSISCFHHFHFYFHFADDIKPCFRKIRQEISNCFLRRMPMDKREAMILEMFLIFLSWNEKKFTKYFESICYIWRSIPDAYITLAEMKQTLLRFLTIKNNESVESVCHEFQRRGFNVFEIISETRKEPDNKIKNSSIPNSQLPEEYDCPDDRFSMHNFSGVANRYSCNSKFQLLGENFDTNSRLSKSPEIIISLSRGVFPPHRFRDPQEFFQSVCMDLILLIRVANSLTVPDNRTIQPHSQFHHKLGASEETLFHISQFPEEPDDPMNPLQYSQEAVRHSITESSQCAEDSPSRKKEKPEDLICESGNPLQYPRGSVRGFPTRNPKYTEDSIPQTGEEPAGRIRNAPTLNSEFMEIPVNRINLLKMMHESCVRGSNFQFRDEGFRITPQPRTQFNDSQEAMRHGPNHRNTNFLLSQAPENPEIPTSQPGNLSEPRANTAALLNDISFIVQQLMNPLPGVSNLRRILRNTIRELLIHNSEWTGDSIPRAGEEHEGKIKNASIPSLKTLEEPDNLMNLSSLSHDSRSASRNAGDLNFQLPDEGFALSCSQETVRYGAIYSSCLPEETEYYPNTNYLLSKVPENPKTLSFRAKDVSESRIRTVMARIVNMPELLSHKRKELIATDKFKNIIRNSLIRNLQWREDCVDTHIRNLQLPEKPEKSTIQTSSLFLCNPGTTRKAVNHSSQFSDEFEYLTHQSENLLSHSEREGSDYLTNSLQWSEDSINPQTRSSQFLGVAKNPIIQTSNQLPYINDKVQISSSQSSEELDNPLRLQRNPLQNSQEESRLSPRYSSQLSLNQAGILGTASRSGSQLKEKTEYIGAQPRRLLHYTRCVIRDALIHNSQLPQGIALLKLPIRLQSYLKLEL